MVIERRTEHAGWTRLVVTRPDAGGRIEYEDAAVEPGTRYAHRVVAGVRAEAETRVAVPRIDLALETPRPNPIGGQLRVGLTLPDRVPARLKVVDAAGRRVLGHDLAPLGPGRHELDPGPTADLPAGLYLVRLTHRDGTLVRRAMLIR